MTACIFRSATTVLQQQTVPHIPPCPMYIYGDQADVATLETLEMSNFELIAGDQGDCQTR
jgi:hypothetical protein